MRTGRMLRWTVLVAILAALAPAPASAQIGRLIKKRLKEKIAQTVIENVVPSDTPVATAPGGAQPTVPDGAKKAAPGRAVKSAPDAASGPQFNDYVLEMTPAVLERLEKGLVAEAAERKAAQRILARMRDKPAYDRCMQELVASPEGKKAYDAMFPPGGQVNQQAAADMQKLQNAKCGPDPNTYGTVENELRNKPSKAGEAASGFQYRQYAILKERVVPFCSLGPSADGGVFQIKQGGGFLVYSTQEVMALGPRCAKLKFALQGVV